MQIDVQLPVREAVRELVGAAQGERGLADAGGAGEAVAGVVAGDGVAEDEEAVRPASGLLARAATVRRGAGGGDVPEWLGRGRR
ncbi:hypothetical protein [Streptomyces caelestis]|uniref:hypothetical protein n=1 Tax=Streptomyces caelestis TaxID=36816 RepID=UPI00364C356D